MRAEGPFAWPAFPLVATFIGLVLTPVTLYLYLAHPAWSWMYLFDPSDITGLTMASLLGHAGMVMAGWYGGARLLRAGKKKELVGLYVLTGSSLVALVAIGLSWGRIGRYGTYVEFHDGRALELLEVKLGYVLVALALGVATAAGFVGLELMRDSRRVRAR